MAGVKSPILSQIQLFGRRRRKMFRRIVRMLRGAFPKLSKLVPER